MSSLSATVHVPPVAPRWASLVCARTGRVLALVPASLADTAKSTRQPLDATPAHLSA